MKKIVLASVVAASVLGFASASFARGPMPKMLGEVVDVQVGDHMMHMQLIEDQNGGQWVVMSREDAEALVGSTLGKYKFGKMNF